MYQNSWIDIIYRHSPEVLGVTTGMSCNEAFLVDNVVSLRIRVYQVRKIQIFEFGIKMFRKMCSV